jgi:hypothetical protein
MSAYHKKSGSLTQNLHTLFQQVSLSFKSQQRFFWIPFYESYIFFGVQVSQPMFNLQEGDLVLEVNGESVLGVGEEEWQERRSRATAHQPWRLVVGRWANPADEAAAGAGSRNNGCLEMVGGGGGSELAGLQEDIALIQSRLEEKLREGRDMGSILHLVQREKEGLERENTRLNHRIFYLEEQVYSQFIR